MGRRPKLDNDVNLKRLIADKGLTHEAFAERIGISRSVLDCYFKKLKTPGADKLISMCRELNISLKELLKALGYDISGIPDD
jgi:transcriptional regulator with XRE-family HTH domain